MDIIQHIIMRKRHYTNLPHKIMYKYQEIHCDNHYCEYKTASPLESHLFSIKQYNFVCSFLRNSEPDNPIHKHMNHYKMRWNIFLHNYFLMWVEVYINPCISMICCYKMFLLDTNHSKFFHICTNFLNNLSHTFKM